MRGGPARRADRLSALLAAEKRASRCWAVWQNRDYFVRRSQWIFGGDGWAYDIGFGGLDHVLASGKTSIFWCLIPRSTPTPAASRPSRPRWRRSPNLPLRGTHAEKIRHDGDELRQCLRPQNRHGADKDRTLRAIAEAEPGRTVAGDRLRACINHGLKAGMRCSQREAKRAVEAGYWHLWRYHPQREAGQNAVYTGLRRAGRVSATFARRGALCRAA